MRRWVDAPRPVPGRRVSHPARQPERLTVQAGVSPSESPKHRPRSRRRPQPVPALNAGSSATSAVATYPETRGRCGAARYRARGTCRYLSSRLPRSGPCGAIGIARLLRGCFTTSRGGAWPLVRFEAGSQEALAGFDLHCPIRKAWAVKAALRRPAAGLDCPPAVREIAALDSEPRSFVGSVRGRRRRRTGRLAQAGHERSQTGHDGTARPRLGDAKVLVRAYRRPPQHSENRSR
jgi:hypothetical protein